MSRYIR